MKSVLISIKPKWCELIASGKKTVEVRKTRPKIETPFKCYIYETRSNRKQSYYNVYHKNTIGKVIGEFVCDRIDGIEPDTDDWLPKSRYDLTDNQLSATALTEKELWAYGKGLKIYGWHISDLKIYNKPKELGEFRTICPKKPYCANRKSPCLEFGHCTKKITRPLQSWGYVEE